MSDVTIIIGETGNPSQIELPIAPEKLGKFISGLLGQPQSIEREILGTFSVDHSWFLHLHALIDQRIRQQHNATCTGFTASIYYEGGLERTVTTLDAFSHFNETKKIRSVGAKIKWTYLINFPGKDLPEKQEITILASEVAPIYLRSDNPFLGRNFDSTFGKLSYIISHTERTWGDDIESILRQELDLVVEKIDWRKKLYEKILLLLSIGFLLAGFLVPHFIGDRLEEQRLAKLVELTNKATAATPTRVANSPSDVERKVDLILAYTDPSNSVKKVGVGYYAISVVTGCAMWVWCVFFCELTPHSFVIFSKEAEQYQQKIKKKETRKAFVVVFSFILSIGSGVIGNYAYLYIHGG